MGAMHVGTVNLQAQHIVGGLKICKSIVEKV
jgi:hypothetical protein